MNEAAAAADGGAIPAAKPRLTFDGRVRMAFILFGGMLALQSSQHLDATKLIYLAGSVVCFIGALSSVWSRRAFLAAHDAIPWLASSAAVAILLAISVPVALANETPPVDWLRDAVAYALFAAAPLFALDAQVSASRRLVVGLLLSAGLLGAASWATEWLGRREILDLPFDRLVFASPQLPAMLYLFALATAIASDRRRTRWAVVAGVVLGLFLVTGSRSALLLLAAPLVMALYAGRKRIRASFAGLATHALVAGIVVLALQGVLALGLAAPREAEPSESATSGTGVLGDRFGSLGEVVGNPASDASIRERIAQYGAAWALFLGSPIFGVGPGHAIEWIDVSGSRQAQYTADTPLVFPAKFGVVGVAVLGGIAFAYWSTLRRAMSRKPQSAVTLTLIGYGAATVVGFPLGSPLDDKGTSLALMLLLALAFRQNCRTASLEPAKLSRRCGVELSDS